MKRLFLALFVAGLALQPMRGEATGQAAPAKKLRVVVMTAHPSDPESCTGGLIALLRKGGHEVVACNVTLFRGDRKLEGEPEAVVRRRESLAGWEVLGARPHFFDYAHEHLAADKPTIEAVSSWLKQVQPDIVVTNWPLSRHENEHQVSSIVWQIYLQKDTPWSLYLYEVTDFFTPGFQPQLYLDIESVLETKKRAMYLHKTHRPDKMWADHEKLHLRRGEECGVRYAEAYMLANPLKKDANLLPVNFLKAKMPPRPAEGQPPAPASAAPGQKLNVVVFGGHCDDPESGAGGLITRLTKDGHRVTVGYSTVFRGGRKIGDEPEQIVRRREAAAACEVMGAKPHFFDFAHEDLRADKATIATVSAWLKEVQPDVVVTHWPLDTHDNHHVTSSLVWQSYINDKVTWSLYFFEVCTDRQTQHFQPDLYLDLSSVREAKRLALDRHQSQKPDRIWKEHEEMHVRRGRDCGVQFAEAYKAAVPQTGRVALPAIFLAPKGP